MSVLHICCNLAGSTVFPQLFEALKDEGLEQTVFVPEKHRSNIGKNEPQGVETTYALTVKKADALFFFRKAQRSVPEIEKSIDLSRVRLIHAHTLFTDGSIAHALYKKHRIPYVVTLRYSDIEAIWKYEPHLHPMARRILMDSAKVVFLSEAAKEKVFTQWLNIREQPVMAAKAAIIPNGIKPEWLTGEARTAHETPLRVGFAGRMNKRKRPMDALAAAHRAGGVLRAVGDGPLRDELIAGLCMGDEYLGVARGMDAMKRFYAQCDVLLVPSSAETFGMVYLEAMSQGVPVLYTRGQGFDGQFPEGEVGFSVVCGDIAQQAQALCATQSDYAQRSARCIAYAKAYAWPLIAKRWLELYAQI